MWLQQRSTVPAEEENLTCVHIAPFLIKICFEKWNTFDTVFTIQVYYEQNYFIDRHIVLSHINFLNAFHFCWQAIKIQHLNVTLLHVICCHENNYGFIFWWDSHLVLSNMSKPKKCHVFFFKVRRGKGNIPKWYKMFQIACTDRKGFNSVDFFQYGKGKVIFFCWILSFDIIQNGLD